MAITDSWLKAHHKKPHEKTAEKADGEGLSARVSPAGKIVFQMRYRYGAAPARLDLGTYPRMSLKEARNEHQRLKAELEQGHDPRVIRQVERVQISEALTNQGLYTQWYEAYCVENKKQHQEIRRSFEIHVFPELGDLPADKTGLFAWMSVLERVSEKVPSIAKRLLQETQQMHKWAFKRGLITNKPLTDVTAGADLRVTSGPSGRSFSDEEITLFFHALERCRLAPANKLLLHLCLFFGCRNGELRDMDPTKDLDFEAMTWTVPPEKNKVGKRTGKSIVRPLIPEVVPLLQEAMKLSLSPRLLITQESKPVRLGDRSVLSIPASILRNARTRFGVEMQHWSMHDLRKTARTNFSTITDVHVAEVMLGHSLKGMQGVYDRHLYLKEQAAAYQTWWQRLEELRSRELR